jgi:anti-sigma regulatory factor (Ser/Thr protein kinase)
MANLTMAFSADPAELAGIRRFARGAVTTLGVPLDLDLFAVVVGELAANAVVHQDGAAEIAIAEVDGLVEVAVSDPDPGLPQLVNEAPWSTDGHRGIQLVAALSREWGVEPTPDGKRVWARLAPADGNGASDAVHADH